MPITAGTSRESGRNLTRKIIAGIVQPIRVVLGDERLDSIANNDERFGGPSDQEQQARESDNLYNASCKRNSNSNRY